MLITLLVTTFIIAFITASVVVYLFTQPIDRIMRRVVTSELSQSWVRYMQFALYVVGIGGGVRVWDFNQYLAPTSPVIQLTTERWVLEVYQTLIGTLQATAMVLLVFFVFALIAVVLVRIFEGRMAKTELSEKPSTLMASGR